MTINHNMTPTWNSILKVIMQIKSISTTIKHQMLPLMLQKLTTTVLPSNHLSHLTKLKQVTVTTPIPNKDPQIITSPTEVNSHRKVTLKDAKIDTSTKGQ